MSPDGPAALDGIVSVSRETRARLSTYVDLIRKWQPAENLVSPATLPEIWRRHVADCAQLVPMFPDARTWVDLGSGAGLPGIVVACLIADRPDAMVHLVESNSRKCAFLRRVAAETHIPVTVHRERIEDFARSHPMRPDIVTARALAPLPELLDLAAPLLAEPSRAAFQKGRDFRQEIAQATKSWEFDLVEHKSRIDEASVILEISRLRRRSGQGAGQGKT